MKRLMEFFKTTVLGGLFVLLPVLLLYLVLAEALDLVVALGTPIADLFPKETFDKTTSPVIIALALIVGMSFLIGLGLRSEAARRLGRSIEQTVLDRLPMYSVLKSLTMGFAETGQSAAFKPAVLIAPDGCREPAYVVEDYNDGNVTVLLPLAPTAFAGPVKIVKREWVEMLDVNLGEFTKALSHWGVGVHDLTGKRSPGPDVP
jgi:uncharacterized membrane protein